jgi:hypothetical protein
MHAAGGPASASAPPFALRRMNRSPFRAYSNYNAPKMSAANEPASARADLKQFFRNMSPSMSEDEMCYRIQEIISLLDVRVEEAWEIYADHPPLLEVYWDYLNKSDE